MNADARGWSLAVALMTTIAASTMASHAYGEEPLFQLTPQIERLGGETLTPDSGAATEEQSSQDDSLRYEGLRLTGPVNVESGEWRLIAPGKGSQRWRLLVPPKGPAPITLDFALPPAYDENNDRRFDHPTRPTPPPRDDSYLLATGAFNSITSAQSYALAAAALPTRTDTAFVKSCSNAMRPS